MRRCAGRSESSPVALVRRYVFSRCDPISFLSDYGHDFRLLLWYWLPYAFPVINLRHGRYFFQLNKIFWRSSKIKNLNKISVKQESVTQLCTEWDRPSNSLTKWIFVLWRLSKGLTPYKQGIKTLSSKGNIHINKSTGKILLYLMIVRWWSVIAFVKPKTSAFQFSTEIWNRE